MINFIIKTSHKIDNRIFLKAHEMTFYEKIKSKVKQSYENKLMEKII